MSRYNPSKPKLRIVRTVFKKYAIEEEKGKPVQFRRVSNEYDDKKDAERRVRNMKREKGW